LLAALPSNTTWKNIETFLRYIADKAKAFDDLSDDSEVGSQWQLLVIEAKSRDAPLISQPGKVAAAIEFSKCPTILITFLFHRYSSLPSSKPYPRPGVEA
jgi:hypothetical protein